jgi:hypothetical protein
MFQVIWSLAGKNQLIDAVEFLPTNDESYRTFEGTEIFVKAQVHLIRIQLCTGM